MYDFIESKIVIFNQLNVTWLKITEDIPWNLSGAKNLGVIYAKSDKIIISDLDHKILSETFQYLIDRKNPGRDFFKIYRKDQNGEVYKGHSNLFFMSRARYLRFYGYDEEFAGNYGYEEVRFVKFQKYHGSRQRYLPKKDICYERDLDRTNSDHSLQRTLEKNAELNARKKR